MHRILNLVLVLPPATRDAIFFIRASVVQIPTHRHTKHVHDSPSARRLFCLYCPRTLGILPPGDVDELLDVADLLRLQNAVSPGRRGGRGEEDRPFWRES